MKREHPSPINSLIFNQFRMACSVRYRNAERSHGRNALMWILVNLAVLVLATLIAGAPAVAVYWLFLRATVQPIPPAPPSPPPPRQRPLPHPTHSSHQP